MKYQAILKNGKNGEKLFKSAEAAVKFYPGQIKLLKEIYIGG